MRKLYHAVFLTVLMSAFFSTVAQADATIDKSNAAKGIISVSYSGDLSKGIKAQVEKDGGDKYVYDIKKKTGNNLPLQMGAGNYTIRVLEPVSGNNYRAVASDTVAVGSIDEKAMYTYSIPQVDYASSGKAIPAYKTLAGSQQGSAKVNSVYKDVVESYSYDMAKAKNVANNYIPVLDTIYSSKMGICYDYASMLAGALRSQGVPVKLCMGYAPEIAEYHAWNEIFVDGKWQVVDSTYDSQYFKAKGSYDFAKDGSKFKVVKVY